MNKKRLIITSMLSFLLVAILMVGSTYSIFTSSEVDEDLNVYTTGNLDVTYTVSDDVFFEDITPMTVSEAEAVFPYRLTVTNVGTVPYQFDVILNDTTSTDSINYQYIMTKVGYLEAKALSDCSSNAIVEDVVVPAGESVDIDIRIWLDESLSNSEIGNSFYANLMVDGLAVYDNTSYVNNDQLSLRYMKTVFDLQSMDDYYKYFKVDTYREKIKNVYFVDYIDTSDAVVESWDLSVKGDNSVIGWVSNNATDGYYDLYIGSDEDIYANSLRFLFSDMIGIETISFDNLNTSLTTDMSYVFASLYTGESAMNIVSMDVSGFNTSNVTTMAYLFSGCSKLAELDVSNFDTSNVTNMESMFNRCESLAELDVSNFDTSNVTDMHVMFDNCQSLAELDVSNFDTSKVTNIAYMFRNCKSLAELDVSNFDTSKVINMTSMFNYCSSLVELDLSNFDTSNVTNMYAMFQGCTSLTSLNISNFNTSNVADMRLMFYNCSKLSTTITIRNTGTTYDTMFLKAATDTNAKIIVNYTSATSTLADSMIATKSKTSNVEKGEEVI